jgi:hypothetical protein
MYSDNLTVLPTFVCALRGPTLREYERLRGHTLLGCKRQGFCSPHFDKCHP